MPDLVQYNDAPAPTKTEFNTVNAKVTSLSNESTFNPDVMAEAIKAITNVTQVKIYVNQDSTNSANGIPAESIAVFVNNGNAGTIAQTIYDYNTSGLATYGSVSRTVTSGDTVYFSRPTQVFCHAHVELEGLTAPTITTFGPAIKTAINNYVNDLDIGEKLDTETLKGYIDGCAGTVLGTYNIKRISVSTDTLLDYSGVVDPGWNGKLIINSLENITVSASVSATGTAISGISDQIAPYESSLNGYYCAHPVYSDHDSKWGLLVILPIYIINKYNATPTGAQIPYVSHISTPSEGQIIYNNGITFLTVDDLSSWTTHSILVNITFTAK